MAQPCEPVRLVRAGTVSSRGRGISREVGVQVNEKQLQRWLDSSIPESPGGHRSSGWYQQAITPASRIPLRPQHGSIRSRPIMYSHIIAAERGGAHSVQPRMRSTSVSEALRQGFVSVPGVHLTL